MVAGWRKTLPLEDMDWVGHTLFDWVADVRRPDDFRPVLSSRAYSSMWHRPDSYYQKRGFSVNSYFARPLFFWDPKKFWSMPISCIHGCPGKGRNAHSRGVHNKTRLVVALDTTYILATVDYACDGNLL